MAPKRDRNSPRAAAASDIEARLLGIGAFDLPRQDEPLFELVLSFVAELEPSRRSGLAPELASALANTARSKPLACPAVFFCLDKTWNSLVPGFVRRTLPAALSAWQPCPIASTRDGKKALPAARKLLAAALETTGLPDDQRAARLIQLLTTQEPGPHSHVFASLIGALEAKRDVVPETYLGTALARMVTLDEPSLASVLSMLKEACELSHPQEKKR